MPRRTRPKATLQEHGIADAIQEAREYTESWRNTIARTLKNLFFSRFSLEGKDANEESTAYLKEMLWSDGQALAFPITINGQRRYIGSPAYFDDDSKILAFAPPASGAKVSIFRFPVKARPAKNNGIPNWPNEQLTLGKEAVYIYALPDMISIFGLVSSHIEEMVKIKNAIRLNLLAGQILPVFAVDDSNSLVRGATLQEAIKEGAAFSYIPVKDIDAVKGVGSGASFQLAELRNAYNACFNEALTILGVDNVGQSAKMERNTIDEVNANNSVVNLDRVLTKDILGKCIDNIRDVLGFDVRLVDKAEITSSVHEDIKKEETEEPTDEETTGE